MLYTLKIKTNDDSHAQFVVEVDNVLFLYRCLFWGMS